uniref:Uncharacterized protein n=1 Tax=Vitrella brassicaformis TaxID=1169539 RepID=A0A7S1KF32_9ALVE
MVDGWTATSRLPGLSAAERQSGMAWHGSAATKPRSLLPCVTLLDVTEGHRMVQHAKSRRPAQHRNTQRAENAAESESRNHSLIVSRTRLVSQLQSIHSSTPHQ